MLDRRILNVVFANETSYVIQLNFSSDSILFKIYSINSLVYILHYKF